MPHPVPPLSSHLSACPAEVSCPTPATPRGQERALIHNLLPQYSPLWAVSYSPRYTDDRRLWAESSRIGRVIAWLSTDDDALRLAPVVAADGRTSAAPATGEDVVEIYDSRAQAENRARELARVPERTPW
jgi:hypothetical protein